MALSRQDLPVLDNEKYKVHEGVKKGAYALDNSGKDIILIATGSEVGLALKARDALEAEGTPTRVVSMPCIEWFEAQPASYRQEILPPEIKARVSVEAGVRQGWRELVGEAGEILSIDHFGASAEGDVLFEQFGFTPDRVVAAAHSALQHAGV